MKLLETLRTLGPQGAFIFDINGDGVFTVTDVAAWFSLLWDWAVWAFFYPGNFVLAYLMSDRNLSSIAVFFEMDVSWYFGWFSGIVSLIAWGTVLSISWTSSVEVLDWFKDTRHWIISHLRRR